MPISSNRKGGFVEDQRLAAITPSLVCLSDSAKEAASVGKLSFLTSSTGLMIERSLRTYTPTIRPSDRSCRAYRPTFRPSDKSCRAYRPTFRPSYRSFRAYMPTFRPSCRSFRPKGLLSDRSLRTNRFHSHFHVVYAADSPLLISFEGATIDVCLIHYDVGVFTAER